MYITFLKMKKDIFTILYVKNNIRYFYCLKSFSFIISSEKLFCNQQKTEDMKNIKIAMLSSNGIRSTIGNIGLCFELVVDFILFLLESAAHNLKSVFPHLFNSFFLLSMLCLFSLNLFYFFLQFPLRYFKFFPVFCE